MMVCQSGKACWAILPIWINIVRRVKFTKAVPMNAVNIPIHLCFQEEGYPMIKLRRIINGYIPVQSGMITKRNFDPSNSWKINWEPRFFVSKGIWNQVSNCDSIALVSWIKNNSTLRREVMSKRRTQMPPAMIMNRIIGSVSHFWNDCLGFVCFIV